MLLSDSSILPVDPQGFSHGNGNLVGSRKCMVLPMVFNGFCHVDTFPIETFRGGVDPQVFSQCQRQFGGKQEMLVFVGFTMVFQWF